MIVAVQGTKSFNDYSIFLRAMGTAMYGLKDDDNEFFIYSAGPAQVNSMVSEFSNITERSMKARGKKIRFFKVPPSWIKENILDVDHFVFFSKPKESLSPLVREAEDHDVDVSIYRY